MREIDYVRTCKCKQRFSNQTPPMHVLVIDDFPSPFLEKLQQLPVTVRYMAADSPEAVMENLSDCEVLILNSKIRVDKTVADLAPGLKLVVRAGIGLDHIDVPYLESKGIAVRNTMGANADSVGEQTIGMLLALRHNLHRTDPQVKRFEWIREVNRGTEITGKTVGIIGYGNTGSAVGRRLAGFRCKVLAYDKYKSGFGHDHVEESSLETIFEQADILTLHVPLTAETQNWVDDAFLARFHKSITLLNLARGPILDLGALIRALDTGKVVAAALDVLVNEKLATLTDLQRRQYENLFARDTIILSPHIGGWSHESLANINNRVIEYVAELLAGE